ncbi:MAG: hypothetical protein WD766_02115 [Gemmatimonadota bacterium]
MMIRWIWILPPALMLVLGGCSKELTAGGLREGEVSAAATDQEGASSARYSLAPGRGSQVESAGVLSGSVDMRISVTVIDEEGREVPVTEGVVGASVPIGTSELVPLGTTQMEVGFYTTVRLRFEEVFAQVNGLDLAGGPFSGTVEVGLGNEGLVIDFEGGLEVREEGSLVVVALRSSEWLGSAEIVSGAIPPRMTVSATDFASAVLVDVR